MINVKEETKGHGEVVWGNKFSTIAGSSTSVTVGAKSSMELAASNSLRFGVKNSFEYGPSFTYHCGPEFKKASKYAPNTETSFGAAETSFGQKLNWANAKITFSDIKEHKFFIAKEGSTSMFTTNKLYSETGFTAGAGYGLVATTGYEAYCKTVTNCRNVMTAMTVLPVLVSLVQNLLSGPGSKDSKPPYTLNSYAGMGINIGATLAPALVSLVAAVNAVAAREGFKNAIKPLSVLDMHRSVGTFMGSDHSQPTPIGLANGLKMSSKGISLGIAKSAAPGAFDKDGDLKFGKLKGNQEGIVAIGHLHGAVPTNSTAYVASTAPVLGMFASEGSNHDGVQALLKRVGAESGDMFFIGQNCRMTASKITLTDIDPSQSETAISLTGGHNNAPKRIELKTKKDQSVLLTEENMVVTTGAKTKVEMKNESIKLSIGGRNTMINMQSGKLVLKTSKKIAIVMSDSAATLCGSNLKVLA